MPATMKEGKRVGKLKECMLATKKLKCKEAKETDQAHKKWANCKNAWKGEGKKASRRIAKILPTKKASNLTERTSVTNKGRKQASKLQECMQLRKQEKRERNCKHASYEESKEARKHLWECVRLIKHPQECFQLRKRWGRQAKRKKTSRYENHGATKHLKRTWSSGAKRIRELIERMHTSKNTRVRRSKLQRCVQSVHISKQAKIMKICLQQIGRIHANEKRQCIPSGYLTLERLENYTSNTIDEVRPAVFGWNRPVTSLQNEWLLFLHITLYNRGATSDSPFW